MSEPNYQALVIKLANRITQLELDIGVLQVTIDELNEKIQGLEGNERRSPEGTNGAEGISGHERNNVSGSERVPGHV